MASGQVTKVPDQYSSSKVVQNDDTTVPVQDRDGKGLKTGRLWASVGDHYNPFVVYHYTPDRSGAGPEAIFKGSRGISRPTRIRATMRCTLQA